jgi:hypothetical protein
MLSSEVLCPDAMMGRMWTGSSLSRWKATSDFLDVQSELPPKYLERPAMGLVDAIF